LSAQHFSLDLCRLIELMMVDFPSMKWDLARHVHVDWSGIGGLGSRITVNGWSLVFIGEVFELQAMQFM